MSTCNLLGCTTCRCCIVVGTDYTPANKPLWCAEKDIDRLGSFLEDHRGHPLVFANEHKMDDDMEYVD